MLVRFWGVRGLSTPTPPAENLRYGGNTSCVEVRVDDQIYIFDCGTGFRRLGHELKREFGEKPFQAHVFVSHFHWDHIQGMPFFRPLYENPTSEFIFLLLQPQARTAAGHGGSRCRRRTSPSISIRCAPSAASTALKT